MRRTTSIATPVAHLVGPGKVKIINGQLAFTARGQGPLRLDPRALRTLLCYGPVGITDEAFQVLFRHEVEVAWMTAAGSRCRGRLVRANPSGATLRLLQHQAFSDPHGRLQWARHVVAAKVRSQQAAARHYQRHGCAEAEGRYCKHVRGLLEIGRSA